MPTTQGAQEQSERKKPRVLIIIILIVVAISLVFIGYNIGKNVTSDSSCNTSITDDNEFETNEEADEEQVAEAMDTNYYGDEVDPAELALAREWNELAATGMFDEYNYSKYRREMTSFGLIGARWHVGHIQPNERGSDRSNGPEDMGWNLFAQNSRENIRLSDNVAT